MKIARITGIIMMILICAAKSYGQQPDSSRRQSITYLSQHLKTDTATARLVNEIRERYKKALGQVMANGALSEQQKRNAIDGLIDDKNRKLEQLLSPLQRAKIIPATERRVAWRADSTARKNN
ncbi:hypothetical protein [Mucilaginibacter psychrotolerans]|uniref:Uncharacterized protein n=1 Tax=Mucilaginibacter psychrotolerans TaxID=1524096 RepID=A0A4Y8S6T4_9SPHI|nr:hypothetical protein [Mucilaginibacter psychrotolerans]TFF34632.1 hypothetical protein E2R66_21245 [Mucilaginibacter psychrotolerans]